ncbi:MAG: hypothetical protein ACRDJV_12505 [Actinomycetota bacterium]
MSDDLYTMMSRNLVDWLRDNVPEGEDADVAINPELQAILVFVRGRPILSCSFEDLLSDPGSAMN